MAITKTLLISNAVCLLGHKPIQTLDNADALVTAAVQAWDLLIPDLLSQNNWRFATKIQPLVQAFEIPPYPWQTVYNLPSGFLKLLRLYPNIYEFDLYANSKLYTLWNTGFDFCTEDQITPPSQQDPCCGNSNQGTLLHIEYIYEPDPSQFPARFNVLVAYTIAAYLALSNAQRPDYAAFLEQQRQAKYAMAAASEAQNRPQYSQVLFPVLANRNIGGFVGNGGI
jgi:hypothetical protein